MARPPVNADSRSGPLAPVTGAAAVSVDDHRVPCEWETMCASRISVMKNWNSSKRFTTVELEFYFKRVFMLRKFSVQENITNAARGHLTPPAWNPLIFQSCLLGKFKRKRSLCKPRTCCCLQCLLQRPTSNATAPSPQGSGVHLPPEAAPADTSALTVMKSSLPEGQVL